MLFLLFAVLLAAPPVDAWDTTWRPKHQDVTFTDIPKLKTRQVEGTMSLIGKRMRLRLPRIYKPGKIGHYAVTYRSQGDGCARGSSLCNLFWPAESGLLPTVLLSLRSIPRADESWLKATCKGVKISKAPR